MAKSSARFARPTELARQSPPTARCIALHTHRALNITMLIHRAFCTTLHTGPLQRTGLFFWLHTLSDRIGKVVAPHAEGCKIESRVWLSCTNLYYARSAQGVLPMRVGGCDQSIGSTVSLVIVLPRHGCTV